MVSAFVGQGRPGRDEGPSQREPALGRRPSTGRPRARTMTGRLGAKPRCPRDDPSPNKDTRPSSMSGCSSKPTLSGKLTSHAAT